MSKIIVNIFPEIEIRDGSIINALVWDGENLVRKDIATFFFTGEIIIYKPLVKFFAREESIFEDEIADKIEEYIESREKEHS